MTVRGLLLALAIGGSTAIVDALGGDAWMWLGGVAWGSVVVLVMVWVYILGEANP